MPMEMPVRIRMQEAAHLSSMVGMLALASARSPNSIALRHVIIPGAPCVGASELCRRAAAILDVLQRDAEVGS